jgi:hypothetical protein
LPVREELARMPVSLAAQAGRSMFRGAREMVNRIAILPGPSALASKMYGNRSIERVWV